MNIRTNLFFIAIAFIGLIACNDELECEKTCAAGEVLTVDCICVEINANPCKNVTCPEGFICDNGNCIDDPNATNEVEKAGLLTTNETWTKDNVYILKGKVVVSAGVILTINAGTLIKGAEGTGSLASALVVASGGKIMAMGTASEPIIFTSIMDDIKQGQIVSPNLDETKNGLWGGLIVLGNAPVSVESGDVAQIEGIPVDDTFGSYGGPNTSDNSGVIQYVSIRHGGATIGEGNEINGLTLGGVGNGTVIENIEVLANQDDGIEFFGGTVNVTNAVVWAQGDDGYDIDQAYAGTITNVVYIAGADSDHGMEVDGPEGTYQAQFTLTKGTFKGLSTEYADFRDGARGSITNCYFFNFPNNADIELDDDVSSANYFAGILSMTGNEFNTSHLTDGNTTVEKIAADKAPAGMPAAFSADMASKNTIVTTPTVGADISVFGWTMASRKGVLNF